MFQILVTEDDENTRWSMEAVLKEYGYHPILTCNSLRALKLLDTCHVGLVVLDIMIPGMDDYKFTKQLRVIDYTLPILMVTAEQLPRDKRKGFTVGTDNYMIRPVDEEKMILRTRALLCGARIVNERRITIADAYLDYDSLIASRGDGSQILPRKEFYLFCKLLPYPDKISIRIQLMDKIWGMESQSGDDITNVHTSQPRKRFEDYSGFIIEAICGLGYRAVKHL